MEWQYLPQRRAEFLIASGRLVMAAFSLLAVLIDPSEPHGYSSTTYGLLAAYVGYSIVLFVVVLGMRTPASYLRLTHIVDMILFTLFMFLTEGPTSPFFVYFVFSLVCATVRWGWRGTLWTAVAALSAFVGMGIYAAQILRDPDFELHRFIIRSVYLGVVAILLGYLGAHEQKLFADFSKLAAWPRSVSAELEVFLRETLERVSILVNAPTLVLVWEEEEEPWLHIASWSKGRFRFAREAPTDSGALVAEPLSGVNFFCPDAENPSPLVVHDFAGGFRSWRGQPLDAQFRARFAPRSILGLRMRGKEKEGYLFVFNKERMTSDDLVLGKIVVQELATRFDHFSMLKQLQKAAAAHERVRLARDLHDGVLQSLTALSLRLERIYQLVDMSPQLAKKNLSEIKQLITSEQRDLRSSIQQLKSPLPGLSEETFDLTRRLRELSDRIRRQWGLQVEMALGDLSGAIPGALAHEIYFIVHESLINSAKHAGASTAKVEVTAQPAHVYIKVGDNGKGFPFRGRYDHATLTSMHLGPLTLKDRISSLGGTLSIYSSDQGSLLEIILPCKEMGQGKDAYPDRLSR